jgi:hypothetical protein
MNILSPDITLAIFADRLGLFEQYGSYFDLLYNEDGSEKTREPISDFRQALVLLYAQRSDRTERHLEVRGDFIDGRGGPAIVIRVFSGGYGRDELSGEHRLEVLPETAAQLKAACILSGKPEWGYTDENVLVLNRRASQFILGENERFMKEQSFVA